MYIATKRSADSLSKPAMKRVETSGSKCLSSSGPPAGNTRKHMSPMNQHGLQDLSQDAATWKAALLMLTLPQTRNVGENLGLACISLWGHVLLITHGRHCCSQALPCQCRGWHVCAPVSGSLMSRR